MSKPAAVRGSRFGTALVVGAITLGSLFVTALPNPPPAASPAVRLLGTTIGVGGSLDGFGLTIPLFFYGTVVPQGDSFHTVPYPAQINLNYPVVSALPVVSDIPYWPQTLKRSESVGAGFLHRDIANVPAGERVTVIGMSQGAQVAELARAQLARDPKYLADAANYRFTLIGDPYQPNGGILARFTSWADLPVLGGLFPFGRPAPADSPFPTTIYQNQYDGFADFPAYFNVPAIVNAVVGILFEHSIPGYVFESADGLDAVATVVGNTKYVTIPQYLPLLTPFRVGAARRLVDAIDPLLRVFVEMGYDRTADPSQVREFSWTTPPEKRREALDALPGALAKSLQILRGQPYSPTLPPPVVSADPPQTPVTEHPVRAVDTSPGAQALGPVMATLSAAGSNASLRVAKLLNRFSGETPIAIPPAPTRAAIAAKSAQRAGVSRPAATAARESGSGSRRSSPTRPPR